MSITLAPEELHAITSYRQATKQLRVLHDRGFLRAYISREGGVVLERSHYEAVTRGELQQPRKSANLTFLRKTA